MMANNPSISANLLDAIKREDVQDFVALLPYCPPKEIDTFHGGSSCLMEAVRRELFYFVQLLLESGAKVNISTDPSPIHLSIRCKRPDMLDLILRFGADVNRKDGQERTVMHKVIEDWLIWDGESRWPYLDRLLSHPAVDVNAEDFDGVTPLDLAVRLGLKDVAEKLLQAGALIHEPIAQPMKDVMPDLFEKYRGRETTDDRSLTDDMITKLCDSMCNQKVFQNLLANIESDSLNKQLKDGQTALQIACEKQIPCVVKALLYKGVNPNMAGNSTPPPLLIAARTGNKEILELLVSHDEIQLDAEDNTKQTALHQVTRKLNDEQICITPEEKIRYGQCLQVLLGANNKMQPEGNGFATDGKDPFVSVPLCPPNPGSAKAMSRNAARAFPMKPLNQPRALNINAKDTRGRIPLHNAALSGNEEKVVELLQNGACLDKVAIQLISSSTIERFFDSCISESGDVDTDNNFFVTFDYSPMAAASSSAGGGQQRNSQVNVLYPECTLLRLLRQSPKHRSLLSHPLVASFLMLKWHNIRWFYYVNFFIYTLHLLFLTSYTLLVSSNIISWEDPLKKMQTLNALRILLAISTAVIASRELLQFGVTGWRHYFRSMGNWIELWMICFICVVLAYWEDPSPVRNFSALAVLLAWAAGLLLLGRHPKLSIFVTMFTTVSITFLRLLLWYSMLLVGFGLSFFLVFNPTSEEPNGFENIHGSLLKVSAMMTGDLEFGDLSFEANPVTSRFIFLAFLFLITIVLLNLLNGMAINDTQSIYNEAELIGYEKRVEMIHLFESIFLGEEAVRRVAVRLLCNKPVNIALFHPQCLGDKTFAVYPNEQERSEVCSCHRGFQLDERLVRDARQRVQKNKKRSQPKITNAQILTEMYKLQKDLNSIRNTLRVLQQNR